MRAFVLLVLVIGGCGFHVAALPADGGGDGPTGSDAPPGVGDVPGGGSWSMPLTITNGASAALPTGFQVGFGVDLDGAPCGGDRANVHVRYQNTDVVRTFDEFGAGNEWTWFPLQVAIAAGAMSTDYTLTCDDPLGTAPSDPTMLFDFVETFANLAQWTTQRSPTVSGGVVTLPTNDGAVLSTTQWGPNHAVDFWLRVGDPATNDVWGGFQDQITDVRPWLIWYTINTPGKIYPAFCDSTTNGCANGPLSAAAEQPLDTGWHLYGVENCGASTALFRLADRQAYTTPLVNFGGSHRIRLNNFSSDAPVQFRDVRVRQAACPPPTVLVGTPVAL